ncbi:MAG: RNA polymerase factor sigma-54, partial [Parachlamydiaceae bacterium]
MTFLIIDNEVMDYRLSQTPSPRADLNLKQTQRLMMSHEMQQALHLLQLPILELQELVEQELEENPVLDLIEEEGEREEESELNAEMDFEKGDFEVLKEIDESFTEIMNDQPRAPRTQEEEKTQHYLESLATVEKGIAELLFDQAKEAFSTKEELEIAELIIGNLEETGLFETPIEEIAEDNGIEKEKIVNVLKIIQNFDPPGIASSSIQEALLKQLEKQGKNESLAYTLIDRFYDEIIHHKIPLIQKELKIDAHTIQEMIEKEIKVLNLHPAVSFNRSPTPYITADVFVKDIDGRLEVIVNNDGIPPLRLNRKYLKLLEKNEHGEETKKFVLEKLNQAKWFMKTLHQRGSTIERLTKLLVQKNRDYFLGPDGKIVPLTMKEAAQELEVHESTIARTVMNKYVDTPRGLLALRSFFNSTFETNNGETLSSRSIKDLILTLIEKEDKSQPLSDEKLAEIIQ